MNEPLETAELLAFTRTVDARSLSRAAAELGVPRATISRRLARLEARLGARLLRRTTRSLALTDAGEALYTHARIVLDAARQAEASVRRTDDAIRGDLRVSVPQINDPSLIEVLTSFARRYPDVRLQVHFSNRLVDLRRDGYDVAFRAALTLEPGLVARTIQREKLIGVAAPSYLAAHGTPRSKADLRRHRCLMGFARGELPASHWTVGRSKLHLEGVFFTNDMYALVGAAVAGLGIAMVPRTLADGPIQRGELRTVLEGVLESPSQIAVVYPERELVPPQVRAFVDEVVAWAERTFASPPPRPPRPRSNARAR